MIKIANRQIFIFFFDFFKKKHGSVEYGQPCRRCVKLVENSWRLANDNCCASITTELFLQNTSQLGITIGNLHFIAIDQSRNHISQGQQRFIDVFGFIQKNHFDTGLQHLFRTGQINQINNLPEFFFLIFQFLLLDIGLRT